LIAKLQTSLSLKTAIVDNILGLLNQVPTFLLRGGKVKLSKAKNGNTVRVHYTGKTSNDTVFGTSKPGEPLEFEIGSGVVLSALENCVIGMEEGEKRTITVPPEEAFGPRRNELVSVVFKTEFPDHITPTLGQHLQVNESGGRIIDVMVTGITEDMVVLDANHPMAGQTLKFEIEMIEII
jgi:FKBP-type peptidyl-prolyl cis-trans isomerase 2